MRSRKFQTPLLKLLTSILGIPGRYQKFLHSRVRFENFTI